MFLFLSSSLCPEANSATSYSLVLSPTDVGLSELASKNTECPVWIELETNFQLCSNIWDILVSEIQISLGIQYSIWKPYLQSKWSLIDNSLLSYPIFHKPLKILDPQTFPKIAKLVYSARKQKAEQGRGIIRRSHGPCGVEPAYGVRTTLGASCFLSRRKISSAGSWCLGSSGSRNGSWAPEKKPRNRRSKQASYSG